MGMNRLQAWIPRSYFEWSEFAAAALAELFFLVMISLSFTPWVSTKHIVEKRLSYGVMTLLIPVAYYLLIGVNRQLSGSRHDNK